MKLYALLFIGLLYGLTAFSQGTPCSDLGQNPATAFPVCGSSVFKQNTVTLCGGRSLPYPGCQADGLEDINPYWYKFTCFQSGTLGFLITPNDMTDDYDWELYDITGKSPDAVYTDGSLVVSNNWSGEKGKTGASSAGTKKFVCGGTGKELFSTMPSILKDHNYLLLISHFTPTQSGYSLEFNGGTAVITDPTPPHIKRAEANCGADKIRISLNKKMKCSSIAADGSDFSIVPVNGFIMNAVAINCTTGFDTDSVELTLNKPLVPGNYSLQVRTGGDGNTVLDNCNTGIPVNDAVPFTILPKAPTPMDSLTKPGCATSQLRLVFSKLMLCSSIAPDGSDFVVTGSYPVTITGASGTCKNGTSREIIIQLNKPLEVKGNFTLTLKRGADGNTVLDECNEETLAGSSLSFSVKDTVNASFDYTVQYGCKEDIVSFSHDGKPDVNYWNWDLADGLSSNIQFPQANYTVFRNKQVRLIVSNGFCHDTIQQTILLDNFIQAAFTVPEDNCPLEPILFTDHSEGKALTYKWDFADGYTSTTASPSHIYNIPTRTSTYRVICTVTDSYGCSNSVEQPIKIYSSCYIDVPNAFTPNGDQVNDMLYPLNAVKSEQLEFRVYNRWGQLLFSSNTWKKGWDGKYNGNPQPPDLYIWMLQYVERDTKKHVQRKGTVVLSR